MCMSLYMSYSEFEILKIQTFSFNLRAFKKVLHQLLSNYRYFYTQSLIF